MYIETRSGTFLSQLKYKGYWAILLTLFLVAYNVNVIPAIMPRIVLGFDSSIGQIQDILILFSLVTASFAPTVENLCFFFGRTYVFSIGLGLYGIGIIMTFLSPSTATLAVSFAIVTGLGATPLVSTPWAIVDLLYDDDLKIRAILGLIVFSVLGGLSGGLLGGFIASQTNWRFSFLPSLFVLVAVWLLRRSLPKLVVRSQQSIDWVGGLLSFLGLASILTGLSLAGEFGWWEPKRIFSVAGVVIPPFAVSITPILIVVGVIFLGLFAYWQRHQADRGKASLLRVGLLRRLEFVLGLLAALLHTLVVTGVQFNLFQFVPLAMSLNPFRTALTIIPYHVAMVLTLVAVLRFLVLSNRIAPKHIVCSGIVLVIIGLTVLYTSLHLQVTPLEIMPGLILMGIGSGLFSAYISPLTFSAATARDQTQCPGIFNPVQDLGSSLGRGILGTSLLFFASQKIVDSVLQEWGKALSPLQRIEVINQLQEILQTFSREEVRTLLRDKVPPSVKPLLPSISLEAGATGIRSTLLIAIGLAVVCLLLAANLPKYPYCRRVE